MSLKKWTAGALVGVSLGLAGLAAQPAKADEGTRMSPRPGVVWLGSLSTGYVVGQDVEENQQMKIVYTRFPIAHMLVQETQTGHILFEGKPTLGQTFWFPHDTNVKFTLWSQPAKEYPPMSSDANAIHNWSHERPVIDAMELQLTRS